jgi:hypothetical protein
LKTWFEDADEELGVDDESDSGEEYSDYDYDPGKEYNLEEDDHLGGQSEKR